MLRLLPLLCLSLFAAPALAGPPAMTPANEVRGGVVAEVLGAGTYCYVRLADETWLATMGACPAVGTSVAAQVFGWRDAFPSARLGRVFSRVGFALITPKET